MADTVTYHSTSIPKFDGFYDHWAELMESLLRSKDYWSLIETGIVLAPANPTPEQTQAATTSRLNNLKVKNYLFQAIDRSILERGTSKQIWESMRQKFQGSNKVKRAQLQSLRREFEVLWMKDDESVNDFFSITLVIANKMTTHGESLTQSQIVEKILRSMTAKFEYVVCSIEQSSDTTTMSIDELQSSLLVQEGRMNHHKAKQEEQALTITNLGRGNGNPRGRGRGSSSRGRGRGRTSNSKEYVECYKCHKLGHYQSECPNWEENADFAAEFNEHEEILLMTQQQSCINTSDQVWFLDSGCSNHMIGTKEWLFDFDDKFRETVKLGDNSTMQVMGKGNVKLYLAGKVSVITDVYYLPELKKNLLSIAKREMVKGLPMVKDIQTVCSDCVVSTQHIDSFPKDTSWRAATKLELIHLDICGPINPTSNGGNRYFIAFTDDLTKKTWTYPLKDKESAFECFKMFKALVEKESNCAVKCLRIDRGEEFTSSNFDEFCSEHGIKRQLTATYTPQQNGVSERKNRTLLNMVRSMLAGKNVPKRFWPEAVVWATYVINRSPTLSVNDMTPEEAWSSTKPLVSHFKVFGCIGYVHIPDTQRKKLDPKGIKCVLLGVSEESKAYKLYDPLQKKIIISKDVVFDESNGWNWDEKAKTQSPQVIEETISEHSGQGITVEDDQQREEHTPIDENEYEENYEDNGDVNTTIRQLPPRARKPPGWVQDYVTNIEDNDIEAMQNLVVFRDDSDPHNYEEASKMTVWRKAMDQEIESIERNNPWELVFLPKEAKRIGVKWIFKTKYNENGEVEKYKARLVAKGYSQQYGIDFNEVFAPVARWDSIRAILVVAASQGWYVYQFDVKSAFLHGELQENVYVDQPPGYFKKDGMVYKLRKALYGLKQAPRAWYSKIESYFLQENFVKYSHEHLNCKMRFFLGVEVKQLDCGIFINQQNPIVPGNKLTKDESGKLVDATSFRQMTGCLMYLLASEPDLTFSVCLIARYMERPTELHLAAAKRVLRYLKGSLDFGILYKRNCELRLEGWSDSDYAGDVDDRKSTSGYVFMLGSSPISWSSKKQPIVTLSTTEAEYVSVASCACQAIWLRRILDHLLQTQECTTIHCDNSSSIKLSKNHVMHGRCKHIDVRYHFLRDLTKEGVVKLIYCSTQDQVADIMTKALKLDLFCDLRNRLGICSFQDCI
ncbi:hypothetical protein TSUD_399870 [Trifolium subterraneum]|uniref:Integrase catalytic domain-containing protein n=1 Tax=Trifolium subterraneum TaxID=3900 RepID=A0A2Z6NQ47_TRISU|nr:hypothetical protein TSUD_399870 [Trifolium subterraneum]